VAIIHRFSKTISRVGLRVGAAFVWSTEGRSPIPRQLTLPPMMIFTRRVQQPLNVPIQRTHDTNPREHRWPVRYYGANATRQYKGSLLDFGDAQSRNRIKACHLHAFPASRRTGGGSFWLTSWPPSKSERL
jgi:hypothetical protein